MQLTSSNWMEVTGDVPEPSRLIVPNSLSEWGITAKGSAPEAYNGLPTGRWPHSRKHEQRKNRRAA